MDAIVLQDIHSEEVKIFKGLSVRQWVFTIAGSVVAIGSFSFFKFVCHVPPMGVSWLTLLLATPLFGLGFFKKDGYFADEYFKILWNYYSTEGIRVYETYTIQLKEVQDETKTTKNKKQRFLPEWEDF